MIRTNLRYHRPTRADEVSALLLEHDGNVAVLSGGTQLLPQLNRDQVSIEHLVDLRGLGLDDIGLDDATLSLGARVTYTAVLGSAAVAAAAPLLARVAHGITGGRQLRNVATLAGSACFSMPGSDMPAVLVALDARYEVHGPAGPRTVPAAQFHRAAFQNVLLPGEFVQRIVIDRADRRTGYCKVKHSAGSWPIVTASAVQDGGRRRVTLGAVQQVPLTVDISDAADVRAAVGAAVTEPWTDILAPGEYRAQIAGVVAARAVREMEEAA
jgi:aerobic carbon-monoxide dehydrogenase medium subunit